MSNNYLINPNYSLERVDQTVQDRVNLQTVKWEPQEKTLENSSGNVASNLRYSIETKKFEYRKTATLEQWVEEYNKYPPMCKVISSALLLYRLLCLFKTTVTTEGPAGYKCTWWVTLKHKESGESLMFGEWKGAAGIWTRFGEYKELSDSFREDTLALINELCAEDCPHPYDGTVAGSVA